MEKAGSIRQCLQDFASPGTVSRTAMCSKVFLTCGLVQLANFLAKRSMIVNLVCSRNPSDTMVCLKSSRMSAETISLSSIVAVGGFGGDTFPLPLLLIKTAKACAGGGFSVLMVLLAVAAASMLGAASFVFFFGLSQYDVENGSMEAVGSVSAAFCQRELHDSATAIDLPSRNSIL